MSVQMKTDLRYSEILDTLREYGDELDLRIESKYILNKELEKSKRYSPELNEDEHLDIVLSWFVSGLHQANLISYAIRYKKPLELYDFKHESSSRILSPFELLKALQSVRYQIEQAHDYQRQLELFISRIAICIVEKDPQYQKADTW